MSHSYLFQVLINGVRCGVTIQAVSVRAALDDLITMNACLLDDFILIDKKEYRRLRPEVQAASYPGVGS